MTRPDLSLRTCSVADGKQAVIVVVSHSNVALGVVRVEERLGEKDVNVWPWRPVHRVSGR